MKAIRLLLPLFALGCGDNNQVNITKTIGAAGGTVSSPSGGSVDVPAGALFTNTNISITKVDAPAPSGTVLVGPAFEYGPDGTSFSTPVTITLPFDTALLPPERSPFDILIYTAPRGSTDYAQLATTPGTGNIVQTTTSHFTVYLPAAPAPGLVVDLATQTNDNSDFSRPGCTPSCMLGSTSCSCSETCTTTTTTMMCTPSGGSGFNCVCKTNGQTLSTMPLVLDCSLSSDVMSAFAQCAG